MFKEIKRVYLLLVLVLMIGVLAACGGDDTDEAKADDSGKKVEIVAKGFQHDFWVAVKDGAEEAAEEHGVSINFVGTKNESTISEQVEMITKARNKDPDTIVLVALDTSAA